MRSKRLTLALLCALVPGLLRSTKPAAADPAARLSAALQRIARNERSRGPWRNVTLTALGVNSYFAGPGRARLPRGISHLLLSSQPGEIIGSARVNFDEIRAGRRLNPLLGQMFTGTHQLVATARVVSDRAPAAQLDIDSVAIDGQQIPNVLIDLALLEFVQPRHPEISRHFAVRLPRHVRRALVGNNRVTLEY